ncbi:MAG: hypothetical protein A2Z72_08935 [Omnitrophica bacterium RBG_13_46_9]|nr:MAG: hypothetical protein A2Z72_08935 [Omnitrophica bacterium RBG_13_46_9]
MVFIRDILFAKSILLSNFTRLRFPFKIAFAVTYRCNLSCQMCNIWKKARCENELTIGEIDNFFKRAKNFSWIGITGGEPFLREDLPEICDIIINHCKRLSRLHFATNGQLFNEITALPLRILNKHKRLKFVFIVSIDGPPYLHDSIRRRDGAWKNAVTTFLKLKEIPNVKAQFGFTISPHNLGRFEETYMSLKESYPSLGFDDINVNVFQKSSFYYENNSMTEPNRVLLEREIKKITSMDKDKLSINNFLRRIYLNLYLKYLETKQCPLKCQAFSSTCFLDPQGDLYPCGMYQKKLLNIRDMKQDFATVWNGIDAKRLSYECSHGFCPACWSPCDAFSAIGGSLMNALRKFK